VTQATNGPGQSKSTCAVYRWARRQPGDRNSRADPNVAVYSTTSRPRSRPQSGRVRGGYRTHRGVGSPRARCSARGGGRRVALHHNKPKLDTTEGTVNAGYSYTAHGDPNSNVDATLNLPLIPDTLAIRAVITTTSGRLHRQSAEHVHAIRDRLGSDRRQRGRGPNNNVVINNSSSVANDINPVTYEGIRVGLLYKLNEDWNALITQSYHGHGCRGCFYEMPYGSEGTTFSATASDRQPTTAALVGEHVQSDLRQG